MLCVVRRFGGEGPVGLSLYAIVLVGDSDIEHAVAIARHREGHGVYTGLIDSDFVGSAAAVLYVSDILAFVACSADEVGFCDCHSAGDVLGVVGEVIVERELAPVAGIVAPFEVAGLEGEDVTAGGECRSVEFRGRGWCPATGVLHLVDCFE
ncbi:hypothetical protein IMSAG192_01523 [Muribaculaceae bacterium]|nr:hypothetical protein IMSAG192_01523 [Muribaculaceae bacterium]